MRLAWYAGIGPRKPVPYKDQEMTPDLAIAALILWALLSRIPRNDETPRLYYKGTVHAPRVYWEES